MKRCPECRRDYYDDTLMYCLDDGNALLEGPASFGSDRAASAGGQFDEPQTAILSEPPGSAAGQFGEAKTRAQIHTTAAEPRSHIGESAEKQSFSANRAAKPLMIMGGVLVLLVAGFFGYRSYYQGASQIDSIAVMPFVNDSGNPEIEYLSDGMTETLIMNLSSIPKLSVKARSAVFFYKGKEVTPENIGRELGVQAVLLGRVTGVGDNLTISLELVSARTQDVIWTDRYVVSRSEIVTLQNRIARDLSAKLRAKLSGVDEGKVSRGLTSNAEAYQAYLKGRYHFNRRTEADIAKSIEEFRRATELDPEYALAFSGLADAYAIYSDYAGSSGAELAPKIRINAERAIALDPQLGEPHATLGILNIQERRWDDAVREGKIAVELNPDYPTGVQWYGSILLDLGRYDEAAEMMKRAHELDPVSPAISNGLSNTYEVQNNFEAAIENSRRYIETNPSFAGSYRDLGLYYSVLGCHPEAVANGEKAVAIDLASFLLGDLGYIYAAAGRRDEALALATELEERYTSNRSVGRYIAEVYSGLGQKDEAMEWLEKDFQSNNGRLSEIRWTIPFRSMHDYSPFKDLIRRMGMPPL